MAGPAPAAGLTHGGCQSDFRRERDSESLSGGRVGRAMVSVLVTGFFSISRHRSGLKRNLVMERRIAIYLLALLLFAVDAPALAQVKKVTADAKGIT